MKNPSDPPEEVDALRADLIGLGERSLRKSYYPELPQRLEELERFKAFLDHSNDAIFLIEVPTAKIVDVNDSSCRQLGWPREELLELSIFDVSDLGRNEKAKKLICDTQESVKGGALVEATLHERERGRFIAEITLDRMFFQESESAFVIAVARDITKRKKAEAALKESEERFRSIFESAAAGMATCSLEGRFWQVNPAICRFFGYTEDELLNLRVEEVTHPEDLERTRSFYEEIMAGQRQVFDYEKRYIRKDGSVIWGHATVAGVLDAAGKPIYLVELVQDITDRKKAEMDLFESERSRHRLQAEVECAADVQKKLLPSDPPDVPGFEFAARCLPAYQVGGDFFDWQETGTGLLSLTLGDVMGKGMAAAMLMATVRASLRSLSQSHPPAMALQQTERALRVDLEKSESFVTLFHSHLNIVKRTLTYVDCGHGYALLLRSDHSVEELLPRGLPFGVLPGQGFQEGEVTLEPGDTLILFSDGLVDTMQELDIEDGMLAKQFWADSAEAVVDQLLGLVPAGATQPDDMTLTVVRCKEEQ